MLPAPAGALCEPSTPWLVCDSAPCLSLSLRSGPQRPRAPARFSDLPLPTPPPSGGETKAPDMDIPVQGHGREAVVGIGQSLSFRTNEGGAGDLAHRVKQL